MGVAQQKLSLARFRSTLIPLPPFAEQKRILAKAEHLLARANAARERLARTATILKHFRQSVLAAACGGRLTEDWREQPRKVAPSATRVEALKEGHASYGARRRNAAPPTEEAHDLDAKDFPGTWTVTELEMLCEPGRPITYGILKPGPHVPDGVPYVRVADYPRDRILDLAGIRRTSVKIATAYQRATLRGGDLLLAIRGTYGRVCSVPAQLSGANITQDTARLSIHPSVNADYVAWCLRSPGAQDRMKRAAKGVAVHGINIGDVRALQIPVPPVEEQAEIVRRVEALLNLADAIEKRIAAATARAEKLTQSILAKAFRGELVPTEAELARREGRDYESALTLLARVKGTGSSHPRKTGRTVAGAAADAAAKNPPSSGV
jgi:type I restriction enzyme S subunit